MWISVMRKEEKQELFGTIIVTGAALILSILKKC
jgi:hypothetical protein